MSMRLALVLLVINHLLLALGLKLNGWLQENELNQWQSPTGYDSGDDVYFPISFPSILYWLGTTNSTDDAFDGDTGGWNTTLGSYYGSTTLSKSTYSVPFITRNINIIIIGK